MNVLIAGGAGLIGQALTKSLVDDGHIVTILSRKDPTVFEVKPKIRYQQWDGKTSRGWGNIINETDAIINLAGENISGGRWTAKRKIALRESRSHAGAAIAQAVREAERKPKVLVQVSGVGSYGINENKIFLEGDAYGNNFQAEICKDWESSTQSVESMGVRRVVARLGVVFTLKGGALPIILLPFRLFVGGTLGSGRQWMPWIHMEDAIRVFKFFINNPEVYGTINVAAESITNKQLAKTISKTMRRPSLIPVPAFILRLILGEMSTVVLDGQNVSNNRLKNYGFNFNFPDAESALRNLLRK